MTPVEILVATKERLLMHGWTSGAGRCIIMTVERAADTADLRHSPAEQGALQSLRDVTGVASLVVWNDRQSSVESVITAVDAAIARLCRG